MAIRVETPALEQHGDLRSVVARVHCDAPGPGLPERLSFTVAAETGLELSRWADPFLIGLLPLAMKLGQPLHLEGPVSTRLAHGAVHYQHVMSTWWPDVFLPVPVNYSQLADRVDEPRPGGVGCCFSGGIDSWYAVSRLRPEACPFLAFQITHALLINGFDQVDDPDDSGLARRLRNAFAEALALWDVRLVQLDTNLKRFREAVLSRPEQISSFGSPLTACAHALAPGFGRFSLSGHATYRYRELEPVGSHPLLDPHLSSDHLQIIHLGADRTRSEKLETLANDPAVQATLRVCFRPPLFDRGSGMVLNCGTCEKCVRTVVMLDIMGRLDDFPTFAGHRHLSVYQPAELLAHIPPLFLDDLLALAERRGHKDWAQRLTAAREHQGR